MLGHDLTEERGRGKKKVKGGKKGREIQIS